MTDQKVDKANGPAKEAVTKAPVEEPSATVTEAEKRPSNPVQGSDDSTVQNESKSDQPASSLMSKLEQVVSTVKEKLSGGR